MSPSLATYICSHLLYPSFHCPVFPVVSSSAVKMKDGIPYSYSPNMFYSKFCWIRWKDVWNFVLERQVGTQDLWLLDSDWGRLESGSSMLQVYLSESECDVTCHEVFDTYNTGIFFTSAYVNAMSLLWFYVPLQNLLGSVIFRSTK